MIFINRGKAIKIRKGSLKRYVWSTLKTGEIMELSEHVGKNNGLEEVKATEGQVGPKKVETKQIDNVVDNKVDYTPDDSFLKELKDIDGIGAKTAEDIVTWGTKEKLIEQIKKGNNLPFRDDVEEKLKRKYEN